MTNTIERGVVCLGERISAVFSLLLACFGFFVGLSYCDWDLDALLSMYESFLSSQMGFMAFFEGVLVCSVSVVICAAVGLLIDWLRLRRKPD